MSIKHIILSAGMLLICVLGMQAQSITDAEYYWDTDPGVGNGISIAVANGEIVTANSTISAAGIEDGVHHLYIRVMDELNSWSHYNSMLVVVTNDIFSEVNAAEYFWDNDPGVGNGTSIDIVQGASITGQVTVTDNLNEGVHYIYVRVHDDTGTWSHYQRLMVILQDNSLKYIIGMEYFWDIDPGAGNGVTVNINVGFQVVGSIVLIADVEPVIHYLHLRIMDETGAWSHYQRLMVIVEDNSIKEIVSMEYFWDIDPGVGNGTEVDIADAVNFLGNVPVSTVGLSLGNHNLYIRVMDETNAWSHYKMITFSLCETFGAYSQFESTNVGEDVVASYTGEFATSYEWLLDDVPIGTDAAVSFTPTSAQELCLIATNACGSDTSCSIVGMAELISVDPVSIPNNLMQVVTLTGFGFTPGATVRIEKASEVIDASLVVYNSSTSLTATFDFNLETIGLWDVIVTQDDASELTLFQGLELVTWIGVSEFGAGNFLGNPYPNPTNELLNIPYQFSKATALQVKVYNVLGSVLHTQTIQAIGKGNWEVDMTEFAAGSYFVEISSDSSSKSYRILKN